MTHEIPTHAQAVLLRCIAESRAYGLQIGGRYAIRMGNEISMSHLYESLAELERLRYVTSAEGKETHERGGNHRKYYRITAKGRAAARSFEDTIQSKETK